MLCIQGLACLVSRALTCAVYLIDNGAKIEDVLETFAGGQRSGTYVFINGKYIGGCDSITTMYSNGDLAHTLLTGQKQRDDFDPGHTYQYDVAVIGGGSGGLACSKVRRWGWFEGSVCVVGLISSRHFL